MNVENQCPIIDQKETNNTNRIMKNWKMNYFINKIRTTFNTFNVSLFRAPYQNGFLVNQFVEFINLYET